MTPGPRVTSTSQRARVVSILSIVHDLDEYCRTNADLWRLPYVEHIVHPAAKLHRLVDRLLAHLDRKDPS